MSHYLRVKINSTDFKTIEVDKYIYIYVRQLENAVVYESTKEKLKQLYPFRFEKHFTENTINDKECFQEYETNYE